jgi:hypothetical protein
MILPGEYAWQKNMYDRILTLEAMGPGAAIGRFHLMVVHSAGFMGKDFSVITGRVSPAGPDRLDLFAEESEHVTDDGEEWSRKTPCSTRMVFSATKRWWRRTSFALDGEAFVPLPSRFSR